MNGLKLSVIIVSWNTRALLDECLRSFYENRPSSDFNLWVVDNASTDGTGEMIKSCYPEAKLVESSKNLGFSAANNLAIRQSQSEYVLLLNPDTLVKPLAHDRLVRYLDENPAVGAVGPRTLNPDGTLQVSCYLRPTLFREFWRLFHLDRLRLISAYPIERWTDGKPRSVEVLLGACMLLRRDLLEEIGLMDEDYYIYSEEVDLCYRVARAGYELHWVPQAEIVHYGGQSTKQIIDKMFLQLYRSKVQYFCKNHGRLASWAYKLILLSAGMMRLAISPLAFFEPKHRRREHMFLSRQYRRLLLALLRM